MEYHTLPLGIVVNWYVAMPKAKAMPIIVGNTNIFNVWVRQPLLAAKLYGSEYSQLEKRTMMDWEKTSRLGFNLYILS